MLRTCTGTSAAPWTSSVRNGKQTAVKVLTEDMKELTGGQVIINGDAKESADILEQIILEKRQGLHI